MGKVLVVDDDKDILALVRATLQGDDRYKIFLAEDGEEAVRIAKQEKPDLIFLDIMMPKMNGYEVCQVLKGDPHTTDIKVIMLTALGQEFDRQKAMDSGADGYFTKPFSPTALLEEVDKVLSA